MNGTIEMNSNNELIGRSVRATRKARNNPIAIAIKVADMVTIRVFLRTSQSSARPFTLDQCSSVSDPVSETKVPPIIIPMG